MKLGGRIGRGVRLGGLPALWAVTALLMVRDYLADPYDPGLVATHAYGHNHEGALVQGLGITLVELAVVYLILRPWSYNRSWLRSLVALVLCLPWTGFSMILVMHAGGVVALHFLWLAAVVVVLFVCSVWSGLAAARARWSA